MEHVVIGVDPHKLSATIEVVDQQEQLLGAGRFTTDKAGYPTRGLWTVNPDGGTTRDGTALLRVCGC